MEAIAQSDPEEMRDAMDLTAENSVAHTYMFFQVTRAEALLDGGLSMSDLENDVSRVGEGYELCQPGGDCTMFDGFKATDGLLTDLEVDGDSPGSRLSLGNGDTVESNGVTAEMLVAYEAITEDTLIVNLRVETTGSSASLFLYSATYRAPDGAQRTATDAYGPTDLGADSHATVMVGFDGVEPGGQVTLEGCVDDCSGDFSITRRVG